MGKEVAESWGWVNSILYNMCKENPKHDDLHVIIGKLNIIGRTYSATVERGAGDKFNIIELAKKIKNSSIDSDIKYINSNCIPLNEQNIKKILTLHKLLTDIFHEATGLDKRSLASKYLHFHAPEVFFIYDSIANTQIRKELESIPKGNIFSIPKKCKCDEKYAKFVYKCLFFRDKFHSGKTPREIDKILLKY